MGSDVDSQVASQATTAADEEIPATMAAHDDAARDDSADEPAESA